MKQCAICNENKELDQFHKKSMGYLGHDSVCKICRKIKSQEKYLANSEAIKAKTNAYKAANREIIKERRKEYDIKNAESISKQKANYYLKNREEIIEHQIAYIKANRPKVNAYHRMKRRTDINYKLRCNLRNRVSNIIRFNLKAGSAIKDLGCSVEELKTHLENKFTEGMSWKNYGIKVGQWSIDHIQALSNFDLTNREQFLIACHYKNLQPMWHCGVGGNISKGNKI